MKAFQKTLIGCVIVGASVSAAAVNLTLQESGVIYNDISGLSIDSDGNITVTGAVVDTSSVPQLGSGGLQCDSETTTEADLLDSNGTPYANGGGPVDGVSDSCIGTGASDPSVYCDIDSGLYYDAAEEKCVIPDSTAPTLDISVSPSQLGDGETSATVRFVFSEPVQQFTASDVSVTNGSISGLARQSTSATQEVWTASFARAGNESGAASFTVAANRYQDALGNVNTQLASASVSLVGPAASCDLRYNGVAVHEEVSVFQWPKAASQTGMDLSRSDVHSYPFTTGKNTQYTGQLSVLPFSNTGKVEKHFWLSECPGGEPLPAQFAGVCEKTMTQGDLYWEQVSGTGNTSWRCTLQTNTNYFLNVRNKVGSCSYSSGCDAKVQHIVAGKAN